MTFSASSLRPTSSPSYSQLLCSLRYNRKLRSQINFVVTQGRKGRWLRNGVSVKSVLNDNRPSFNNYGAPESARLLERLFEQTQKLDNRMIGEEPDLRDFESDLLSALMELKEKEDHLQEVERTVLLENGKLKDAKEELERQESEIKAAREKYERLEDEMKEATASLVSQAGQIEEMKLRLRDRDSEIDGLRDALSLKEEEMEKMKIGLAKKSEEAAYVDSELRQKVQLLSEANEIVKKQEIELLELRSVVRQREEELRLSVAARDIEGEKLKVAEASLEKHTMEWLLTQEELKRLEEEASRHAQESSETLENFRRVKKLLSDVRSELVSSQQSLASSRYKMQVQEGLLEQQLAELADQRESVMLYMENLKDAQIEVENERTKLRVADALNKELEQDLSVEKELMKKLQEELKKERASLEQAVQEMASLQEELDIKSAEFKEKSALLDVKESELVDAKLQIQELKTEKASLQSLLEEKDLELSSARKMLVELNQEISDLKMLMNDKETQLIEATNMLREKDDHVKVIQNKLNNTSLKAFEAETVVERVLDLTNKLVASIKNEDINSSIPLNELGDQLMMPLSEDPTSELSWQQKRLENVLELTKENLKTKEMEVLAAQRALTIKDEELKMTLARLDAKEEELRKAKDMATEDANDHKMVYAMTQERIGEKTMDDLAIEKLQLEAAQLEDEVEAATSTLQKLAEMSQQLLNKAMPSVEADSYISLMQNNNDINLNLITNINCIDCLAVVKAGVARLSALTEQLVMDAGLAAAS